MLADKHASDDRVPMENERKTGSAREYRIKGFVEELAAYYGIQPTIAIFGIGFAMCFCYSSQRLACNGMDGWFQIAQYCGMTVAALAFALVSLRLGRSVSDLPAVRVVGFLACLAVCPFVVLEGPWLASPLAMTAVAVVDGAAFMWLIAVWGAFYARLEVRQAFVCVCGFLALSSLVKLFLDLLGHDVIGTLVLASMAVFSALCLHAVRGGDAAEPDGHLFDLKSVRVLRGTFFALFIIVCGVALCMSLTQRVFGLDFVFRATSQVTTVVLAILAIVVASRAWTTIDPFKLWFAAVVVIVTGIALGALLGEPLGGLSSAVFTTAQMLSIGFVWLTFSDIAHRGSLPHDVFIAAGWGLCFSAPMALGLALPHLLPSSMSPTTCCFVVIWLLLVALLFLGQRQAPELRLFADFAPKVEEDEGEVLTNKFERLGAEHGLTPRELEVVTLYAQGRSRSFISTELFISENTVRDHLKCVYRKCGIHNKQELIDLIG